MKTLFYLGLVIVGLVSWCLLAWGVGYLGSVIVHALITWPILRFALIVFFIGGGLFLLSEQWAEISVIARERRAQR